MPLLVRPITRLASVALITVALASCGSSGSKSADTTAAKKTTTTAAKSTTTTAEETTTTTGSTPAASTTPSSTPTTSRPTSSSTPRTVVSKKDSPFCNGFVTYSNGTSGSTSGATPAALRKVVEASQDAVSTIRDNTPGELTGDVNTVFDAYDKFIAALDKVDFDVKKVPDSATKDLESPKVEAAAKRVETFVKKDCGFDL